MRQPQFSYLCITGKLCRFIKCHMLILPCFFLFIFFPVHSFTDKKIRTLGVILDGICRSCICTVRNLQSFSCRSQHHIRRQHSVFILHHLSFLQYSPVFLRNLCFFRAFYIKLSCPVNFHCITITQNIVVDAKCLQSVSVHLEGLFRFANFNAFDGKRKLRRNHPQRIHYTFQSFRTDQR